MSYAHLSQGERYQIQHLHNGGFSAGEIGMEVKRATTTISRELLTQRERRRQVSSSTRTPPEHETPPRREHAGSDQPRSVGSGGSTPDD